MRAPFPLERLRRPQLPTALAGVVAVLRLLPRLSRRRTAVLAAGVVLSALLPVAIAVVTGLLIGSIPATVRHGLDSAAGTRTTSLLVASAVLVVLQRATGPLLSATASTLGRELDRHLQERVLAAVGAPRGIAHLEDPDVLNEVRIVRGLGMDAHRPSLAVTALQQEAPVWLRGLGSAAVLVAFHWWLGLVWLVAWPTVVYVTQREYLRIGQVTFGRSSSLRRSEYLRDLALTAPAAKELRVWGMLDWLVARFETAWQAAFTPVWAARRPRPGLVAGIGGVITVLDVASYGLLVWAAIRGDLGLGALAVFVQALAGVNTFGLMGSDSANLVFASVTVPKVVDLADRLSATDEHRHTTYAPPGDVPREEIRFDEVTFRYPKAEQDTLVQLQLAFHAGRSLAIVGENGAGKTSLVKLLCRMYEPTAGRIAVDGTDLSALDPAAWRSRLAVLFQDFTRYHLSARDNIGLGAPQYGQDLDRLRAAADQAGILGTIEALPHGWDTILSREYTGGTDLSGGQWQRIALARAMFAVQAGARVLVLDEPTAALDVRAEAELYDRFLDLTQGLTTILISHRFSTVRRADRIVVLAGGRVVEDGTHDELVTADGQYAHMFTLQAQRFHTGAGNVPDGDRDG